MVSFFVQSCDILKSVATPAEVGQSDLASKRDYTNEVVVADLSCRIDPVRFRSRESMNNEWPGVARELEFHSMIYTDWTEETITNDMRIRVRKYYGVVDVANDNNNYEWYNIVSVNRVTSGIEGHHLEIEVYAGLNV